MDRRSAFCGAGIMLASGLAGCPGLARSARLPKLTGYLRTNWSRDPYSYGSYSFIATGSGRRDHRRLAEPLMDRVFFAGEAANRERNSSVHAALESGRRVAGDILEKDRRNIGVIGAGISGLVAAHILGSANRTVQVIEARNRIGGRIHTDNSLGVAADLGASWLHGSKGNPLTEMTSEAGMRKIVTGTSWIARNRGVLLAESDLPGWIDEISRYDNRAGTTRSSVNRRAYALTDDYGGDEVVFPDGYGEIFKVFGGDYEVALERRVSAIEYDKDAVRLTSNAGVHVFDAVIVTVPLGVLKSGDVIFRPGLPHSKIRAIERLGFGVLDKIYLRFDRVFWDKEPDLLITPFTGYPQGYYNNWLNLYALFGEPMLLGFNGGPAALALSGETDRKVVDGAVKALGRAYGLED